MKFKKRKKAKIRLANEDRVERICSHMIGVILNCDTGLMVRDQTKIRGNIYLLVKCDSLYAIYRIVKVGEYVELSAKKMNKNKQKFSNHNVWRRHSTIEFTENGEIKTVRPGDYWGPYNRRTYGKKAKI